MSGQQEWDWREARRLAGYVRAAGRSGLHRTDADRLMGGTVRDRSTAFGMAYSKRWIDVCGQWIVLPCVRGTLATFQAPEPVRPEPDPVLFRPHGSKWRRSLTAVVAVVAAAVVVVALLAPAVHLAVLVMPLQAGVIVGAAVAAVGPRHDIDVPAAVDVSARWWHAVAVAACVRCGSDLQVFFHRLSSRSR